MSLQDKENEAATEQKILSTTFAHFLESMPPNEAVEIRDLVSPTKMIVGGSTGYRYTLSTPDLQLHCPHDACNGTRFFRYVRDSHDDPILSKTSQEFPYMNYRCSNCGKTVKTYSLAVNIVRRASSLGVCTKFGELPVFGPPTPSRLIKLIGPDRETFLKGRRCENQGLGIGAFIYYRRVVENQKNRILSEIIKVAQKLDAKQEVLDALNNSL